MIQGKCEYCGGDKAIRNPTGNCDHLYYPDNVNKNFPKKDKLKEDKTKAEKLIETYLCFKEMCVKEKIFDIDEIIKLFGVFITS